MDSEIKPTLAVKCPQDHGLYLLPWESYKYGITLACDGCDDAGGCKRGLLDFGLHTGVPQFWCHAMTGCNYVLCDVCYKHHKAVSDTALLVPSPIVTPKPAVAPTPAVEKTPSVTPTYVMTPTPGVTSTSGMMPTPTPTSAVNSFNFKKEMDEMMAMMRMSQNTTPAVAAPDTPTAPVILSVAPDQQRGQIHQLAFSYHNGLMPYKNLTPEQMLQIQQLADSLCRPCVPCGNNLQHAACGMETRKKNTVLTQT
jgi:hypothetical protein